MQRIEVPFTTDASGDATVDSPEVFGLLAQVEVDPGTCEATVDLTLTEKNTGLLLATFADVAAVARQSPRTPVVDTAGSAIAGAYTASVVDGAIEIVVAQGGDTLSGTVILSIADSRDAGFHAGTVSIGDRRPYNDISHDLDPVTT